MRRHQERGPVDGRTPDRSRRRFLSRVAHCGITLPMLALAGACQAQVVRQRMPVIGCVGVGPNQPVWDGFRQGMRDIGWIEGQTYRTESAVMPERADLADRARKLASIPVDVFAAFGSAGVQAALEASRTIPIVMFGVASDPVALGFVSSMAHPGGNVTGVINAAPQLSTKRLELLLALVPGCARVGVLGTPGNPASPMLINETQAAADQLGLSIQLLTVDSAEDVLRATADAKAWGAGGLLALADGRLRTFAPDIIDAAQQARLPAVYTLADYVRLGGLVSYGEQESARYGRAASFVDRILRGANPADLPAEYPSAFDIAMNQTTARALSISIPPDVAMQVTQWMA
jgi:putative ABC transport system substrate-binding protein